MVITARGKWTATFLAVLIIAASLLTEYSRRPLEEKIEISARSAIIIDASNGQVLYEKNADDKLQPASTVKLMTAVVAMSKMPLDGEIIPTRSAISVEPTNAGLKPGVSYSLKDLIEAILIKSANDASVAIAEGVSGDESSFAELMNEQGKRFGMDDTNFTGASGLPANPRTDQYTTARDLSKMMRHVIKDRVLIETLSKKEADITGSDDRLIHLTTHNKTMFSEKDSLWGKTGYTIKAQRTFVGIDPSFKPRIIVALMKSKKLWKDLAVLKEHGIKAYDRRRGMFLRLWDRFKKRFSKS